VLFSQHWTYRQELPDTVAGVDEAAANVDGRSRRP
jgi:hypothetical protein